MIAGGEVIQAVTFANSVLSKVADVITREKSVKGAVKSGLDYIKLEMKMVISEIKTNEKNHQGATHESKVVLLKELAYDIEDFIDRTWVPGASSGPVLSVFRLDPRPEIVQKIEHFKDSIQKVRTWQPDAGSSTGQDTAAATWSCPSATPPNPYSLDLDHEATLRNICKHRCELQGLLSASEGRELKVISIVGCRGVGKTSLATAVYDDCRADYDCVAWVVASACRDLEDLLTKLLKESQRTAKPTSTPAQGSISDTQQTSLWNFLSDKRYFVVIDDVDRLEVCQAIKREFPKDGHSSRIIVTTSMHSVAAECSWGSYVYTMQCLDKDESEQVFWESVGQENKTPALRRASEGIITKCGGLPLALISVANYLRRQGRTENQVAGGLTTEHCKSAACTLGDKILKGQDAEFLKINRALLQCYNNLPDYAHQSCLLYASVFPRGRPIRSKLLLRRWMSEEFAAHGTVSDQEGVVRSYLQAFIERCIVEPVEIKNARVARCRVHSIMLEFLIHKAVSKKFVALVDKDELLSNNGTTITNVRVRRLSVQDSSKEGVDDAVCTARDIDLSVMRSLTIFKSPLLRLQACELLRVLDLEGCNGVNNDTVLKAICKQRLLKYLSLRGTDVDHLHPTIKCLEHLETLDIRDTLVKDLPIQVIRLPLLAHLFGRIELPRGITKEISKQSKLQTLAGVVVTEADTSFENIILHAGKLRKVKIYQATSYPSNSRNKRIRMNPGSISPFPLNERFTGSKALQILSVDSSDLAKEFIKFLEAPCAITSIKLRGQLDKLPATPALRELCDLNRLLLISTGLSIEDLSALQSLPCLEYLKLTEDGDGFRGSSFVVKSGGFPSLRRLCFEAPRLPQVQIEQGSMKSLAILDLLCPDPVIPEPRSGRYRSFLQLETRLGVEGVSYLENLKEVILHHSMWESKVQAWKEEAIRHNNKPSVKRQPQPTIYAA
ncbi:disease resistance protein RGA4-like [Hordeum vulgare subsp. vulgare]|uniref:disease resistance protein RGA4-like n=1 Tax=Hordeum vulgare subsp. vulgare TaxID=112509 RepID=UPI000B4787A9|nr:disease resistance protein RGA4-like [Hordeum vulgare subsp. vulgare]